MKNLCFKCFFTIVVALCICFWVAEESSAEELKVIELSSSDIKGWKNIYIDGETTKYVCIETYDVKKASGVKISYKTLGFTVSRCKPGETTLHNGVASEYVIINRYDGIYEDIRVNELVLTSDGKECWHNIWKYPLSEILLAMRMLGYDDWAEEVNNAFYKGGTESCYLKYDAIMIIVENDIWRGMLSKDEGMMYLDSSRPTQYPYKDTVNYYATIPTIYPNRPEDQGYYIDKLKNAVAWGDKNVFNQHYNLYISQYGKAADEEPEEEVPGEILEPEDTVPDSYIANKDKLYKTHNYSSTFDISEGIPSGEKVTNAYDTASFTGNEFDIKEKSVERGGYSVTYNYYVEDTIPASERYLTTIRKDSGQMGLYMYKDNYRVDLSDTSNPYANVYEIIPESKTTRFLTSQTYRFKAQISYQYLASAPALYEFESIRVYNDTFPNGYIYYNEENSAVPDVTARMHVYSKEAESMGLQNLTITDGNNVAGTYDYTPGTAHYSLGNISIGTQTVTLSGDSQLYTRMEQDRQYIASQIANVCWSRNDYIMINDGETAFILMDDEIVTGAVVTETSTGKVYVNKSAADTSYAYGGNGYTMSSINENMLARRATGEKTVIIPEDVDNGDFPTGIRVVYRNLFNSTDSYTMYAGKNFFSGTDVDSIYDHVRTEDRLPGHTGGDPADGYPIRIHTPVVALVEIVKADGNPAREKTQLVEGSSYNASAENQLLLDSSYFIKWNSANWYSATYGDIGYGEVFDEYVENKWMRFPFEVVYNNILYDLQADGFTRWIAVEEPMIKNADYSNGVDVSNYESANHWQMTPFYIPSFATEGGEPLEDIYIQVKVEAQNVEGKYAGSHTGAIQYESINSIKNNYVAWIQKQVQLSGLVYDFTVVGSTNKYMYTGEGVFDDKKVGDDHALAFSPLKWEFKSGVLNRFGTPYIRFLTDGSLTNNLDPMQTLPLRNGQSLTFSAMGTVWKGQTFAYTLKTIGNLDGPNDYIGIIPSFTYITSDGEILKSKDGDMKMYEVTDRSVTEYDPANTDVSKGREVSLGNTLFDESYYNVGDVNAYQFGDWVTTSVTKENADNQVLGWLNTITNTEYLSRKTKSYTLSHIHIPATLRYISGEYEQLFMNMDKQYVRGGLSNLQTYDGIYGFDSADEQKFIYSMQQWQSMYCIPSNVKIIDTRNLGGRDFDIMEYIDSVEMFNWEDDIVEDGEGYLIVNFDITVYKNGQPYLKYSGGNGNALNMWEREGAPDSVENPVSTPDNPDTSNPKIPLEDGDIVIIDMSRSINDYFEAGIFNIN